MEQGNDCFDDSIAQEPFGKPMMSSCADILKV